MKDVYIYNENECSIAGIENTFSGRYIIRDVLNKIMAKTTFVIAVIQRPISKVELSINSISNISSDIEDLRIDDNLFSLSFTYGITDENDSFIQTFMDIWFEYEQPAFCFFVSKQDNITYNKLSNNKNMFWTEITSSSPGYVLFRGIEEDVMWIGKSNSLEFDEY